MYDKNNIFARITRKEVPAEVVYEDDNILAIKDVAPCAAIHVLVLPKKEYISFHDFMEKANAEEIGNFYKIVQKICIKLGIDKDGYRVLSNIGENGLQTVPHMHLHILGGEKLTRK